MPVSPPAIFARKVVVGLVAAQSLALEFRM